MESDFKKNYYNKKINQVIIEYSKYVENKDFIPFLKFEKADKFGNRLFFCIEIEFDFKIKKYLKRKDDYYRTKKS